MQRKKIYHQFLTIITAIIIYYVATISLNNKEYKFLINLGFETNLKLDDKEFIEDIKFNILEYCNEKNLYCKIDLIDEKKKYYLVETTYNSIKKNNEYINQLKNKILRSYFHKNNDYRNCKTNFNKVKNILSKNLTIETLEETEIDKILNSIYSTKIFDDLKKNEIKEKITLSEKEIINSKNYVLEELNKFYIDRCKPFKELPIFLDNINKELEEVNENLNTKILYIFSIYLFLNIIIIYINKIVYYNKN